MQLSIQTNEKIMKNSNQTVTGNLTILRNEKNSSMGNPRYLAMIGGTVCYTRPNAMLGYGLSNYEGKIITANLSMYRGKLCIDNIE